jgi:hypothetical protein
MKLDVKITITFVNIISVQVGEFNQLSPPPYSSFKYSSKYQDICMRRFDGGFSVHGLARILQLIVGS